MKGFWNDFKSFAVKGSMVELAIGVVIGAAFGKIVNSLVSDILMPPLGKLTGNLDFSNLFLNLSDKNAASLAEAKQLGIPTVNYGLFINNVIDFAIVAFAIFLVIKQLNRLKSEAPPAPAVPAATPEDVVLLREIRDLLKKA